MEFPRCTIVAHTINNGQYITKECKRLPVGKGRKNQKDKKAIKRSQFKEKKQAYIQAKAAYEACMNASTDDEDGTSNSDNDEDSNRSVSTYSSEDSNIS
jgi:hypothetical protein